MSQDEKDVNDCEAWLARNDTGAPKGGVGNAKYRCARRTIVCAALDAIKERTPRHRLLKRTLRIARQRYGMSIIQTIMLCVSIARFVQGVWLWWQERKEKTEL